MSGQLKQKTDIGDIDNRLDSSISINKPNTDKNIRNLSKRSINANRKVDNLSISVKINKKADNLGINIETINLNRLATRSNKAHASFFSLYKAIFNLFF